MASTSEHIRLYDLVKPHDPETVLTEVRYLLSLMLPDGDFSFVETLYADIIQLFQGSFPGFRECTTKYHDLEHTSSVLLSFMRLLHGAHVHGVAVSESGILTGACCALFHDTGLIQTTDDRKGTGAKYSVGHEYRSSDFARQYLRERGFPRQFAADCATVILSTMVELPFGEILFRNEELRLLGQILGTADVLAQMADRSYLEKLLLLYQEFQEAGIPGFDTELTLLEKTEGFYKDIAKTKLDKEFGNVKRYMKLHFLHRWNMNKDLYEESIKNNIAYLKTILDSHRQTYRSMLRRGGIVARLD